MPSRDKLSEFTAWCAKNITGDEKGQAQIFLDRLFQAFGQPGSLDVGGQPEFRIRKATEDGGGTAFADYVWKPVALVEMKKRGENLQKHYRQAFDYWTRLVPNRPRYVVLCNFDEFRVYDFDTDLDTPKDTVALKDLPERWGPLAFLAPGSPKPTFENDREKVTREAADCLADCFRKLVKRGVAQPMAQRFTLQMLVALFAEDIDLLPKYFVTQVLEDCSTPASTYDLIGDLSDVRGLFERGGLAAEVVECFVCYLAGHNRPVHEVLFSRDVDMSSAFEDEFAGMARNPITLAELQQVRRKLKKELPAALTPNQRQFLLGLVVGEPDWRLMKCPHLSQLPAIRWKLQNLAKLKKSNLDKITQQAEELRARLAG